MKKLLVVLGFLGLVYGGMAQDHQGHQHKKMTLDEKLVKDQSDLNLAENQMDQWKAVHEKYKADSKEERAEKRKAMHKELEAILTAEQLVKFKEMHKNHHEEGKGMKH